MILDIFENKTTSLIPGSKDKGILIGIELSLHLDSVKFEGGYFEILDQDPHHDRSLEFLTPYEIIHPNTKGLCAGLLSWFGRVFSTKRVKLSVSPTL